MLHSGIRACRSIWPGFCNVNYFLVRDMCVNTIDTMFLLMSTYWCGEIWMDEEMIELLLTIWRRWLKHCRVSRIRLAMNSMDWGSFREIIRRPSKADMIQRVHIHGSKRLIIFFEWWLEMRTRKCCLVLVCCQRRPNNSGTMRIRDSRL